MKNRKYIKYDPESYKFSGTAAYERLKSLSITCPMESGYINDWTAAEDILLQALATVPTGGNSDNSSDPEAGLNLVFILTPSQLKMEDQK